MDSVAVAREVRASVALEVARRGWRAKVDLAGSDAAPIVVVSVAESARPDPLPVSAVVTDAPIDAQVRALLERLDLRGREPATVLAGGSESWCSVE